MLNRIALAGSCLLGLALAASPAGAALTTPVPIPGLSEGFTVEQVTPNVFVARAYANMVIYGLEDGVMLVDTMRPAFLGGNDLQDIRTTLDGLKAKGLISSTAIKHVANTHWHPDHVGNNDALGTDRTLVAGRGGKLRLATPQSIPYFGAQLPAWPSAFLPGTEIPNEAKLADGRVRLSYAPYSHTTTDLIVTLPREKVLVVGDLIIQGWLAFTDNHNGGTMRGLVLTVEAALDRIPNDYKVVPGHNLVMTKAEAQAWIKAIRAGIGYVDRLMKAGKSLAEIQAAAQLPMEQGGVPASLKALDGPLLPLGAFVGFVHEDLLKRDKRALVAARKLARKETVSRKTMARAIRSATAGPKKAAGAKYDTFAFQVSELQAIDALSAGAKILSDGAVAAFATYSRYVERARAEGRTDLTLKEYAALLREL